MVLSSGMRENSGSWANSRRGRRDQIDQRLPRDDFLHLFQELALPGFLHAQAQIKDYLFHGSMMVVEGYARHTGERLLRSFLRSA
jgi:hypothetical protein